MPDKTLREHCLRQPRAAMPLREPNSIRRITQLHDIGSDLDWAETLLYPTRRRQDDGRRASIALPG